MASEPAIDLPEEADLSHAAKPVSFNDRIARRQRMLLAGGAAIALVGASVWIFGDDDKQSKLDPDSPQEISIAAGDMVNRNLSQKEWIALSGNRLNTQDQRLKTLEGQGTQLGQLQEQLTALQQENQTIKADGQRVISAYEAENAGLRNAAEATEKAKTPASDPFRGSGPAPTYGPAGGYDAQAMGSGSAGPMPSPEVKVISFGGGGKASDDAQAGPLGLRAERPDSAPVVIEDSPEYLPPNSYATARVIVGVDASAGVNSQTDPLPVVLRITGPARSVVQKGKVLTTRIEGCVVNGAARGDLSAEKIYVKLAKMTCDQPGGRVAVSEVKGFISFGGKAGVRGRVVSREGALVGQALLAGIAGGFGRGFSANANSALSGVNVGVGGKRDELSTGDIVKGGFGQGVGEAGDMVSKYLIERAEQYQPVIEMPTGIDVEIVFLDGVYVRTTK
jgi:conjugal transfer pilus assembly protein TraB